MINSIKFTGEYGYITKKIPEPECSVRGFDGSNGNSRWFSDNDRVKIKEWKKEYKEWEKHKDEYLNPHLMKNLLNRKIEFKPGKINLIFGPNASGKTTILKALAGNSGTEDGYSILKSPGDIRYKFGKPITDQDFRNYLNKMMLNSAEIEWDGSPIYYDNFANRKNYGQLGDLGGSVLGDDLMEEVGYLMMQSHVSRGQNSIYLFNKLAGIADKQLCYADIFSEYLNPDGSIKDDMGVNDVWENAYMIQLKYYMGFEKSTVKSPGTFLFDEIDKSLDINNIYMLYTYVLPKLVEKTGIQVIIISHSPLILSEMIRNGQMYNFISIDEEYTKKCLDNMKKLF